METVDIVLICVYLAVAAAIGVLLFSVVRRIRMGEKMLTSVNGIPAGRIALGTAGGTVLMLAAAFLAASGQPLIINGARYDDRIWLKTADMFIITSLLLIIAAAGVVVYGMVRRHGNVKE